MIGEDDLEAGRQLLPYVRNELESLVDRLAILVAQHLYITISILLRWVMGPGGLIEEEDRINICQGAA